MLTNCTITNATVDAITASNCSLTNGFYDPSDLTGSIISGSTVMNSNVTYSNVTGSTIINSNINNSVITSSTITNATFNNAVVTGATTMVSGRGYFVNTTSSAFTITLPAGTIGDEVSIIDYAGTFDSNNCTIAANGSEKIHGSTDDLTVATERAGFTLVYTDGTQGWLLKDK